MTRAEDIKRFVAREGVLFVVLLFAGFVVLPLCVYLVGTLVFGAYEAGGLGAFFGSLQRKIRGGEPAALFLLMSPWILWQLVRSTLWLFRRLAPPPRDEAGA